MIVATPAGNEVVQSRTQFVISPGSWEANIMGAMGITRWASPALSDWMQKVEACAVACAVRLVSESIGTMIARVYEGDALERSPVYDAPQAELLQYPCDGVSSFDFWQDIAGAVETTTAGFAWKVTDRRGQVVELLPLDPDYFQITGPPHARVVSGYVDGRKVDVTGDVIVVRSWSPKAAAEGVSTPDLHQRTLRYARSYADYTGRWFDLDGTVSQVIEKAPDKRQQRLEMAVGWMKARKERNVGMLWGEATLKDQRSTIQDAQAAEIAMTITQEVARAWRIVPPILLLASVQPERFPNLELPSGLFYRFSLMHRIRRIERAFSSDRDLFADRSRYMRLDATEFLRADTATLAALAHSMRQDGSANADEERALVLGWPPLPNGAGEEYQQTPVGGGANTPPLDPTQEATRVAALAAHTNGGAPA